MTGPANEMFSDFQNRTAAVPQIAPFFGVGKGNTIFDGAGEGGDFGLEQVTGSAQDRYRFRTSPLRNVALQPTFFHNGAFTRLDDAIAYHLETPARATRYDAGRAGVARDLRQRLGPIDPVLQRLDALLTQPRGLGKDEFEDLVEFVRTGQLDRRANTRDFCRLVPQTLPSGRAPLQFEGCRD